MFLKFKDKQLFLKRIFLVILDILIINIVSILALITRFDFKFSNIPNETLKIVACYAIPNTIITVLIFLVFKLYHSLWKYASVQEFINVAFACFISSIVEFFVTKAFDFKIPLGFYPLYFVYLISFVEVSRFIYRFFRIEKNKIIEQNQNNKRIMIIGAGEAASTIIKEIINSKYVKGQVICAIDDNSEKWGNYIQGVRIYGGRDKIIELSESLKIDEIIVAMPAVPQSKKKEILNICKDTNCELKILPGLYQLVNGEVNVSKLRKVEIDDLLGREPISVNLDNIMQYVKGKTVMITGGGGSIGSELSRQIANYKPKRLIIVDIYENNAYDIQQELKTNHPELDLVVLIASVRNTNRLDYIFNKYRPDIVYHAAAHKHVPLMEDSPNEAIKNNVFGTLKTVKAADKYRVQRFVLISTDKAVNPTNIMGASKRICEMIVQTYNNLSKTEFVAVRFGNVLGSNGSVIPLFKKQIAKGGPVTVTHPDIIRYFMTIPEAVSLVLQAGAYAKGGEIFVLDMGEPVKIADLAKNLIKLSGYVPNVDIEIKYTGLRPGEKLYEELLMKEEGLQSTENKLIHIGKPIQLDEEEFLGQLDRLYKQVINETSDVRKLVQEIVPTYVVNYH